MTQESYHHVRLVVADIPVSKIADVHRGFEPVRSGYERTPVCDGDRAQR
jgi:hypothetical protein